MLHFSPQSKVLYGNTTTTKKDRELRHVLCLSELTGLLNLSAAAVVAERSLFAWFHCVSSTVMQVDQSVLSLDSSGQEAHGVMLSGDDRGVLANLSFTDLEASLFFDGLMAQIKFQGAQSEIM